jgi:hypothetical protein
VNNGKSHPTFHIVFELFIFNCVLFKKIRRRSLDDVVFAEFDRNPNFILDDILPDVVERLRNHEKYSHCSHEH